jgi:hypothetical protein
MRTIKMHHWDCVSYLLVNDRVVVEWWVEYGVAYDIQWQEDMHMWQSVAWSILVCGCSYISVPKRQCLCLHQEFVMPRCWETKYDMLLQMVNVQNFDAKIYQHVIKWQKAMRLIKYCCMLVAGSDVKKSKGQGQGQG